MDPFPNEAHPSQECIVDEDCGPAHYCQFAGFQATCQPCQEEEAVSDPAPSPGEEVWDPWFSDGFPGNSFEDPRITTFRVFHDTPWLLDGPRSQFWKLPAGLQIHKLCLWSAELACRDKVLPCPLHCS